MSFGGGFEALRDEAQKKLNDRDWPGAREMWEAAAEAAEVAQSRAEFAEARRGEALAIFHGVLPPYDAKDRADEAFQIHSALLQEDRNELNLRNHLQSVLAVGRIGLYQALAEEKRLTLVGIRNIAAGIPQARRALSTAREDEGELTQRFPTAISPTDSDLIELAACSALGDAFDGNRQKSLVAQEAREALDAARKAEGHASSSSCIALVAIVANRLVTPHPSWRRSLAVRLSILPGVLRG